MPAALGSKSRWQAQNGDLTRRLRFTRRRPVLNYGAPIWIPLAAPSTLAKLEVVQNVALRIATGNVLMAPISLLHSETKVLPLSMHLKLCGEQFYASALQTVHPSHECVARPIGDRLMKHSLRGHPRNPGSTPGQKTSPNVWRNTTGGELRCSQNPPRSRQTQSMRPCVPPLPTKSF